MVLGEREFLLVAVYHNTIFLLGIGGRLAQVFYHAVERRYDIVFGYYLWDKVA